MSPEDQIQYVYENTSQSKAQSMAENSTSEPSAPVSVADRLAAATKYVDKFAQAQAYGFSRGVQQMTTLPAKAISAAAHATLPNVVNQYIATPGQIQNYYNDIDKVYQQGTTPGMSLSSLGGSLLASGGELALAKQGALGLSGNLIPEVMNLLPKIGQAAIEGATTGGIIGGLSNNQNITSNKLINKPGALFGMGAGAVLGPFQQKLSEYFNNVITPQSKDIAQKIAADPSKLSSDQIQNILKTNINPETGTINITQAAQDLTKSGLLKDKPTQVLVNLGNLSNQSGLVSILEKMGAGTALGAGVGGAIGLVAGGEEGMYKGAKIGGTIGAGVFSSTSAIRSIMNNPTIQHMIANVDQWAANTDLTKFFINRMDQAGIIMSLDRQTGTIQVEHKDDRPQTSKPVTLDDGTKINYIYQ